jgi:hypothetical protein
MLPLVLYVCVERDVTEKLEHRLGLLENGTEGNIWTHEAR